MAIDYKPVTRIAVRGQVVDLYVRFLNSLGEPVNADVTPKVSIADFAETTQRQLTNLGISLADDPGLYHLAYTVPLTAPDGYWTDTWVAIIGGEIVTQSFEFHVLSSGTMEEADAPGNTPGDPFEFEFSEDEVRNVNKLLGVVKKRLKSNGVIRVKEGSGYVDKVCNIFNDDELICFLVNSLSEFNQTPHFTKYTFAQDDFCEQFMDILVQGASILALAAQALIEKGREFVITDNGVSYQPPVVSDMLNSQYTAQMTAYREKLKFIKCNMKSGPKGLGSWRILSVSPAYQRLRHRRAGQIY